MIKKILVAVDGSKYSDKALDFALDLAEKCHADTVILNVFHEPAAVYVGEPFAYPVTYPIPAPDFTEELKKSHEKILSEALKKAKKLKPNLNVSTELREGQAAGTIVETAKKGNFDIAVLGHRGMGKFREFLLGSVSERVAHDAHCSVLIVK
jgi:nucleotide-binding universal stress UspA family protein